MPPKVDPSFDQHIISGHHYNGYHDNDQQSKKIRVCIIGAGAAGLVNARILKTRPDAFDIEVYEKSSEVGGTWVYNERVGVDEYGNEIHSSMYKNLRTNLPLSIMQFSDFPCKPDKTGFVGHEDILCYLKDYTAHFDLRSCIKFRHEVLSVMRNQLTDSWYVVVRDIDNNMLIRRHFDSVLVCNGRYSKPKIPNIKEKDSFDGKIIHCHDYRSPEKYAGQRIVVLGAGPSGIDISIELAAYAKHVYLCHNLHDLFPNLPDKLEQVSSSIESFKGRNVIMKNGQIITDVDTVFFATGYDFDFHFLHESCQVNLTEGGNRVKDLYLHLINAHYPSMAIWAVPCKVIPFPFYEHQARLFMKVLLGEIELPSKEDMIQEAEEDFQARLKMGIPARHAHEMSTSQLLWEYEDKLVSTAKIPKIRPVCKNLFTQLYWIREQNPKEYKDWDFVIVNDHEFHCIKRFEK